MKAARIYSPNLKFWELRSDKFYGYVLWRDWFEWDLSGQVRRAGGKVWFCHEGVDFDEKAGSTFVAADGVAGVCRRVKHLKPPSPEDLQIGVQKICIMNSHPENRIDLYLGHEFAPSGYAWVFPEGNNRFRIGLGVSLSVRKNPLKLLDKFVNHLGADPIYFCGAKLVPTALPEKQLAQSPFLFVGDAGLLCDPLTGGGIANAIESGRYAARAISEGRIRKYDGYCSGLKRRNTFRYKVKKVLSQLSDEDFNEAIEAVRHFHPNLTRVSWAMVQAIATLVMKKPRLIRKYRILKTLIKL